MKIRKLSELTFEIICEMLDRDHFSMHYDASDALRIVDNIMTFEGIRNELMNRYGDVNIEINRDISWFDQVKIIDETWKEDNRKYCAAKQAWCNKYGCD